MTKSFVSLHSHTDNSKLDGAARIPDLVKRAEELGMPAVAVTDHGSMSGFYDLYKATQGTSVKPIYGIEAYLAPDVPRTHKEPVRWNGGGEDDVSGNGAYTHMTLLAETTDGLYNLFKMSTEAFLTGFYRSPRMDLELLQQYGKGIIATTGCPSGEVQTWLRIGDYGKAREAAAKFRDIFGKDNFFVEVMDHGLAIEKRVIPDLLRLAKDLGLGTVATTDLHYVHQHESHMHDALLCIGSGSKLSDPNRFKFDAPDFYLKTAEQMRAIWDDIAPDACDNTLAIAERVTAQPRTGEIYMPDFPVPDGETTETWLMKETQAGLERRFPDGISPEHQAQAEYEVGVMNQMGFPGYFLVTADFINWAKENGIRVGPGRGSAAGSIVAYALGITDLDPLEHGLMFERFLNPERVSMPDIDVDFDDRRRGEVIDYVREKYGDDKVTQLMTRGFLKGRAAIKDSARVLDMPYQLGDKLNKVYPKPIVGRDVALKDIFNPEHERYHEGQEFRDLVASEPGAQQVVDLAMEIEGIQRGVGMHAAGVVMAGKPLVEITPLMRRDTKSPITTAVEYQSVEELGGIKFDFLGLSNLGTIDEALRLIRLNRGVEVDLDQVSRDLNDPATFDLVARGDTLGVFQLDSAPMRSLLKLMEPDSFDDISAVLALYRPGPMAAGAHTDYADRKNKRRPATPIHPELADALAPILGKTHQLIVYQEQVMKIAQDLAGYSLGKADLLRRAMGKKDKVKLAKEFEGFRDGMRANGFSDNAIEALWEILVPFSDYAFNLSHSAAYGLISYQTAYLKANFPAEYMAALLTTNADNKDKLALYLGECRRMGIEVLVPDVNESELNYTAVGDAIRTGLIGVKGVGEGGISAWLVERRTDGKAKDLVDLLMRADTQLAGKKAVEALNLAGAFDSFGLTRSSLSFVLEEACEKARKAKKAGLGKGEDLLSMFDGDDAVEMPAFELTIPDIPEWDEREKLAREREVLGLYVSGHPLAKFAGAVEQLSSHPIAYLRDAEHPPTDQVKIAGLISAVEKKTTKASGDPWAIVTVEDLDASMQVFVFPRTYAEVSELLVRDAVLTFTGRVEKRDDGSTTFAVKSVSQPDLAAAQRKHDRAAAAVAEGKPAPVDAPAAAVADDGRTDPIVVQVAETALTVEVVEAFKELLEQFPGSRPVHLVMAREGGAVVRMALGDQFKVAGTGHLAAEIRALLGPDAV